MNVHPKFKPFNFPKWIEVNRELLKPPVSNKLLFDDAGMIVQITNRMPQFGALYAPSR